MSTTGNCWSQDSCHLECALKNPGRKSGLQFLRSMQNRVMNSLLRRSMAPVIAVAAIVPHTVLARQAPVPQSAAPLTIGETFTLQSAMLKETRRINVYLPQAYTGTPTTRLPVIYMPDGGMAEDFLHVSGLVQVLTGNGTMRPFILVGIENTERRRDLSGPTENAEDKKMAPRVGGSQVFRTFIRRELMPAVQARYRTTDETAIVGESLAGLFVVETFLREPDLFNTYIAFDPSLWWNDGALVKGAAEDLRANRDRRRSIYMATSSQGDVDGTVSRLAALLTSDGGSQLTSTFVTYPAELHSTIYHPAALAAFRAVFKPPK
jgi:predicted alpha/beta superfamily hydrolase